MRGGIDEREKTCNPATTPHDTALMCSSVTYVSFNADQTYMFADDLHLTTRMHTLLTQYVEQQLTWPGAMSRNRLSFRHGISLRRQPCARAI
jgi:phospholipase/lecithinase/hemolysin